MIRDADPRVVELSDELLIIFATGLGACRCTHRTVGRRTRRSSRARSRSNIGDLTARWTGDRRRSSRHLGVLAPPVGVREHPGVIAHEYPMENLNAITVG
ncbi:hypothetical protein [Actinophytocola sp.]|uniref:hypothetical protein n=1 Tax=Actinophytocola sp. TaxID=1872138 RepID=UPI0025BAEDC5|nr:hypothetical protein [Actinophytocola sp.]